MKTNAKALGVTLVFDQGLSITAAAKQAGLSPSALRLALMAHPDYEKVKAAGKLRTPIAKSAFTDEDLRKHPAVLAIVDEGLTYEAASKQHGVSTMTLYGWVKRVFPDKVGSKARSAKLGSDQSAANAILEMLDAQVQTAAAQLNTTPAKLLRVLIARVPDNT